MRLATIAIKNVARNRLRTLLTSLGVAAGLIMFIALRTMNWSWTAAEQQSASDRIGVRHKITFIMPLPLRYAEEIRNTPGVTAITYANWFGAKDPKNESDFFATIAVEPADLLNVYREIEAPPEQVEAWKQDRRGALVGDALAKKKGWKVGDKVTLRGTIYPGDWEFHIAGIYTSKRASVDRSTLWFHWKYLNDSLPQQRRDKIGWVVARVADPGQSAAICRAIDQKFSERDVQTLSMSERAMQASFLGMLSAILRAIDVVSVVILLIMMLILGNTIAMGVRDRTGEYGVLRAIGFVPRHIVIFVVGESLVIGLLGGLIGVGLSYPLVQNGLGRFLEENMGAIFPYFRVQPSLAALSMGLALGASLLASAIPAYRASKLKVVDSLRRVG
ncbi:MAG: FtsX-like permease family protein [Myxococcota bacterium]|nr:FtsX-like permease family protein [Myxococcota bacterium]